MLRAFAASFKFIWSLLRQRHTILLGRQEAWLTTGEGTNKVGLEQVNQVDGRSELLANECVPSLEHIFVREVQPKVSPNHELAIQFFQMMVEGRELATMSYSGVNV